MRYPTSFNVRPRYGAGSPAMVNQATAERVAQQEKRSYEHALEGVYGEEHQERAKRLGLRGIAEGVRETRKGWEVIDLITGEQYLRPFDEKMRKDGFCQWQEMDPQMREMVAKVEPIVARAAAKDSRWTWFRVPLWHEFYSKKTGYDPPAAPANLIWEPRLNTNGQAPVV